MTFEEAAIMEPMGVAYDLFMTSDIKLNNDVLVLGCGPIGLMALQMAKTRRCKKIYAAEFSTATARCEMAKKFGADEIIYTDKVKLEDYEFEKGGVDRVLVTAPPKTIGSACNVCNTGGIVSFLGISYNEPTVTFDSNVVHLNKLQIRGSNAIPALYFPLCIDLVKAGIVDVKSLVSHTFELDNLPQPWSSIIRTRPRRSRPLWSRNNLRCPALTPPIFGGVFCAKTGRRFDGKSRRKASSSINNNKLYNFLRAFLRNIPF